MEMFNLTIKLATGKELTKGYTSFEKAKSIVDRMMPTFKRKQLYYTGTQLLSYISIDKVQETNEGVLIPLEYDMLYVDGERFKKVVDFMKR